MTVLFYALLQLAMIYENKVEWMNEHAMANITVNDTQKKDIYI